MSVIKVDYGEVGGGGTYIDEVINYNDTKTFNNVTTGVFWMSYNGGTTCIAVSDGVLIEKQSSSYGNCSYTDGIITFNNGNYSIQTIHGYYV